MSSTIETYCGWVAIVGRPNVGKSTLLNRLLGQKVAITACKPQTTRHRILGINTDGPYQAIYVDTPGIHGTETQVLNRLMNRAANQAMWGVDLIIWVVEGIHWTADDELVLRQLRQQTAPVVLAINKVDLVAHKSLLLPFITDLSKKMSLVAVVPLSAERGEQISTIATLVRCHLPSGPHHFPEEQITDRSQRFLVAEIIREKLIRFLGDELPYATTVEIEAFKQQAIGHYLINGLILVNRAGQKKIVIGAQGKKIKVVGSAARLDIETLLAGKVHLVLWVKVRSGWADDERVLARLGYGEA